MSRSCKAGFFSQSALLQNVPATSPAAAFDPVSSERKNTAHLLSFLRNESAIEVGKGGRRVRYTIESVSAMLAGSEEIQNACDLEFIEQVFGSQIDPSFFEIIEKDGVLLAQYSKLMLLITGGMRIFD